MRGVVTLAAAQTLPEETPHRALLIFVAFLVAGGLALGATIAAGTGMLVLALCIVPPAILLMMWPSAPTLSVAEVLRNVDRSS